MLVLRTQNRTAPLSPPSSHLTFSYRTACHPLRVHTARPSACHTRSPPPHLVSSLQPSPHTMLIASTSGQKRSLQMCPQVHLPSPLRTISASPRPPSPPPTHGPRAPILVDSPHQSSSSAPPSPRPSPRCVSLPPPKPVPPILLGLVPERALRPKLIQLARSARPAHPSRRSSRSLWWSLQTRTTLSALASALSFVRGSIGTVNSPWS